MKYKEKLKYDIERKKTELKQKQHSLESTKLEIAQLEQEYNRACPRMFLIREMEEPTYGIVGKWEKFVVMEVYTEQDPKSLGPKDIFVKEVSK